MTWDEPSTVQQEDAALVAALNITLLQQTHLQAFALISHNEHESEQRKDSVTSKISILHLPLTFSLGAEHETSIPSGYAENGNRK